jgi:membrane protease subunit HflC
MQAYETGLKGESRIIVSPKSDFFRYFTTPTPTAASTTGEAKPETQTVK